MDIDSAIKTVQAFLNEANAVRGSAVTTPAGDAGSLLDAGEAATYLNLSVSWVYKAAERGGVAVRAVGLGTPLRLGRSQAVGPKPSEPRLASQAALIVRHV